MSVQPPSNGAPAVTAAQGDAHDDDQPAVGDTEMKRMLERALVA